MPLGSRERHCRPSVGGAQSFRLFLVTGISLLSQPSQRPKLHFWGGLLTVVIGLLKPLRLLTLALWMPCSKLLTSRMTSCRFLRYWHSIDCCEPSTPSSQVVHWAHIIVGSIPFCYLFLYPVYFLEGAERTVTEHSVRLSHLFKMAKVK